MNLKKNMIKILTLVALAALSLPVLAQTYSFAGGPSGGTFQYYAGAISQISKDSGVRVLARASKGSIENIRLVNSGKVQFSVAYSGHVFAALNGNLKNDAKKYDQVLALAYCYGAPAQLIVKADSGITSAKMLEGKRVGVGNPGSGAAANAELFFGNLGLWDKMGHEFLGYRQAAAAFKNGQLDAFWVFAGFPNSSVLEAALQSKVNLINVYADGEAVDLFKNYPYFSKVIIPANTYKGQTADVTTFQDSTIWVAKADVSEEVVYNLLKAVFCEKGLAHMVSVHKSAKNMTVENALNGIVTPLHPGAEKFWREKGILK